MRAPRSGKTNYRGQFLLTRATRKPAPNWSLVQSGEFFLHYCPSLRLTKILDDAKNHVGWVLGYAVSPSGTLLGDTISISVTNSERASPKVAEQFVGNLSGRYVAILLTDRFQRLYLDPAGQLSVVHNKTTREIGSSLFLVSEYSEPTGALARQLNFPQVDRFFPFGVTHDDDVCRLLPNHYLDLNSHQAIRHWPPRAAETTLSMRDSFDAAKAIGRKLSSNIQAISDVYPISMPLTAGRDSRMLLAASRDILQKVEFYTMRLPDAAAELDCKVASALSRQFGLNHRILEWQTPSKQDLDDWQLRGGFAGSGRTWKAVRTLCQLDPDRAVLEGLAGEVGRCFYWRKKDFDFGSSIDSQELLKRLGFPESLLLLDLAERWIKSLPMTDVFSVLDLLYVEQRLGCWAGPNNVAHINNIRIIPFSDRVIFSMMASLAPEYRFSQRLTTDLIEGLWPDLLKFPFNQEIGLARLRARLSLSTSRQIRRLLVLHPSLKRLMPWVH